MTVEVLVFDRDRRVLDFVGQIREFDRRPVLVRIDLVEQFAVAVIDVRRDREVSGSERFGRGKVAEEKCHREHKYHGYHEQQNHNEEKKSFETVCGGFFPVLEQRTDVLGCQVVGRCKVDEPTPE